MRQTNAPKDLQAAGKMLWKWLIDHCDGLAEAGPMASELCRLADRLAEVRDRLRKEGLTIGGKRNPLADIEIKLTGQYQRCWRILGLSDRS